MTILERIKSLLGRSKEKPTAKRQGPAPQAAKKETPPEKKG